MRMPIKARASLLALAVSFVTAAAVAGVQPSPDAPVPEAAFRDVTVAETPSLPFAAPAVAFPAPGYLSPDVVAYELRGSAEAVARPLATATPSPAAAASPAPAATPRPAAAPLATARPRATSTTVVATGGWHMDPNVSWYGPGFYGHRTACGQALTETLIGVASRTLACGTLVEFRYAGRTVTAPVVDRGPYVAGRQWDLTAGLAIRLGHLFTGPLEWRLG